MFVPALVALPVKVYRVSETRPVFQDGGRLDDLPQGNIARESRRCFGGLE